MIFPSMATRAEAAVPVSGYSWCNSLSNCFSNDCEYVFGIVNSNIKNVEIGFSLSVYTEGQMLREKRNKTNPDIWG